ncbi:MAG: AMP-binding protein [Alphaproteobacteria bacterium]|nr:AMP-binding protein [Alphaproteobacteria bacterium]
MYKVHLTESYFPAQVEDEVLDTTVASIIRERAARTPNAEALVECDMDGILRRRWTFEELLKDAETLARALLSRYKPGERIAVWAPNIPEWVIIEYAAAIAGLTLVTANPANKARELKYVLEQSRSVGLFIVNEYRGNPMARIAAEVASQIPAIREVVDLKDHSALFAGQNKPAAFPEVKPDDPAQVQYTSGTTGFPKGAVLHHRGLTNNSRMIYKRAGVREGETSLNFMPMFHTSGCAIATLGAMQGGMRMIIAKVFEPNRMLDIVEAERVEALSGVPTMLVAMLEAQAARPRDLSSIERTTSGGSMVPPELIRKITSGLGCEFITVYGQTETSPVLTQTRGSDTFEDVCDTVGQALPLIEISIRDPQTNTVTPVGAQGEICSRGYCNMLGYNDNPKATAEAIDAEGWLHTGDLGTMDSRGYVKVTGRVKEMIIRGGENLFPAEIENVILEHPTVAECAVVGLPDERWGEIVACFVRLNLGATLNRDALVAHCRERMSAQKTPVKWFEVIAWPLTGSGKIQKFVLREQAVSGALMPH